MIERFKKYFAKLERLSSQELDASAEHLVRAEKQNIALVIAHIAEISRRKSALECGYKNTFDYCVRRLKLSEGSVARRLQVANVCRQFPQILGALAANRLSLTVAGLLAPYLTNENVEELLRECAGMSKRDVEEHLVKLAPRPEFKPSIRKAPTPSPGAPQPARPVSRITPTETKNEPAVAPRSTSPILAPAQPDRFNFRFSADGAFKRKFERLAEVLGVENASQHMASILEQALEIALENKDPKRKHERRIQRAAKRKAGAGKPPDSKSCPGKIASNAPGNASRYIPSAVRDRVHARAGYQCEYRGPDGTRCRSRTGLEIEHTRPFAMFRTHDERFLKLFCRPHNRLSAEKVFGATFIEQKIEASRNGGRVGSAESCQSP